MFALNRSVFHRVHLKSGPSLNVYLSVAVVTAVVIVVKLHLFLIFESIAPSLTLSPTAQEGNTAQRYSRRIAQVPELNTRAGRQLGLTSP